ncbi:MAG: carboxymuconolactone decarboxylase family protein [Aureispira sp.]
MTATLYKHLKPKAPTLSDLHQKYDAVLQLVNVLIGTIPNCDVVMEIWPTSFKTYNLLVPNLLHLPNSLFGSKSVKKLMGLAMYESSAGAGCNYCTAHCCSFAMRRGISKSTIAGNPSPQEAAVIDFSRKMGAVPCRATQEDLKTLQAHCSPKEVEAISMGIVLMGFLNKFMDVVGVELEQDSLDDVYDLLKDTDWQTGKHVEGTPTVTVPNKTVKADSWSTYLKVLRQAPRAIKLEKQWLRDIPKPENKIKAVLKDNIGYYFPLLEKLQRDKLKRTFVAVLSDNFSEKNTVIGLRTKIISSLVFCAVADNPTLENYFLQLANANKIEISAELHQVLVQFTNNQAIYFEWDGLSANDQTIVAFTKHASKSPSTIHASLIDTITQQLSAEGIIELSTWLSIVQMLYRLEKLPMLG